MATGWGGLREKNICWIVNKEHLECLFPLCETLYDDS